MDLITLHRKCAVASPHHAQTVNSLLYLTMLVIGLTVLEKESLLVVPSTLRNLLNY
jgi:hypothetical protein